MLAVEYQIVFIPQPHNTPVGKEISPGVTVQVRDNGSPVEDVPVTIDLGPNPPNPAELSGDRTRITGEDGTVTFEHLKLDYLGNGYTLVASTLGPRRTIVRPLGALQRNPRRRSLPGSEPRLFVGLSR